jgi:hypothetical protein
MAQEIEMLKQETNSIANWANGLFVSSKEEYQMAYARVKEIKRIRAKWVAYWGPVKTKAHAAWKEVVSREKAVADLCDAAERMAKDKADAWFAEQQRIAAEEQRRLQAIADEKARKERERLEKEALKLKTPELREERLAQAAEVEAPIITVEAPEQVEGVSTRTIWKARVVDMAALIDGAKPGTVAASFLMVNQQVADSFARATKNSVPVPGVEFIQERGVAVRRGE